MTLFILTIQNGRGTLFLMNADDFLLQSQNADGGWGYRKNARSVSCVEPTATVMLALDDATARSRGRDFLRSIQRPDGGWGIAAMDSESGWMTAWAVRALADPSTGSGPGFPDARDAMTRGANWLIDNAGLKVTGDVDRNKIKQMFKIDSALRGWSWQQGDASWVHPTALAILALVVAGQRDHARVREGVQYLFDRATPSGGWNVGNPWMLDKQIPATIQDTAVALRALREAGESVDEPRLASAIQFLRDAMAHAKTPAELAWGVYALKSWQVEMNDAITRLNALQKTNGSWNDNPFITAIAVTSQK